MVPPLLKPCTILYFSEVSVNNIIIGLAVRTCICLTCSHIGACLTCSLCLLINLCEQSLCGLHQLLLSRLDICHLTVGKLLVLGGFEQGFQCVQISLNTGLLTCVNLIAYVCQSFLCLEYEGVSAVSRIDSFFSLLILSLELSCFSYSLVDIVLRHVGACSDRDVLLLACAEILGGYVYDTVRIDVECNLDLRYAAHCRRDSVQTELAERLVVLGELSFTL